jgi:hypothetical protein
MRITAALVFLSIVAAVSLSAAPTCTSGSLSDYVALGAGGCSFDDVTFWNFQFSATGGPAIGDVSVQPTGTTNGSGLVTSPVLDFNGTWLLRSGPTAQSLSLTISYDYAVLAPYNSLLAAQLQATAEDDGPNASEFVVLNINGQACTSVDGPSSVLATNICSAPASGLVQDTAQILTLATSSSSEDDTGEVGNISNGFLLNPRPVSSTMPEPSALTLAAIGCCGLAGWIKRNSSRRSD